MLESNSIDNEQQCCANIRIPFERGNGTKIERRNMKVNTGPISPF